MAVKITNMVKFYAVLLLNHKPMHGYEIIMEIGDKIGRKISAGQIYPFLQSMQKNGYLVHGKPEEREKKLYHLTPKGKKFVAEMIGRFGGIIEGIVESKAKICVHCNAKVLGDGHVESIKGKNLVFCCCYCAASYKSGRR
jgi:DNA-binding PadR family transcriptional regulator